MSSVNRILKRRKEGSQQEQTSQGGPKQPIMSEQYMGEQPYRQPQVSTKEEHVDLGKEKQFE